MTELPTNKQQLIAAGFDPRNFGLEAEDPVLNRFAQIHEIFASLQTPFFALCNPKRDELYPNQEWESFGEPSSLGDFEYGIDYVIGQYEGSPRSVEENAKAARFHGTLGAPLHATLKSVAYSIENTGLFAFAHVRGDQQVDEENLAGEFDGKQLSLATPDQLSRFGLEKGVVSPLINDIRITHVYARDLFEGPDYPDDDMVFTSSGMPEYYVYFNIRKYVEAKKQIRAGVVSRAISIPAKEKPRLVARRPVIVIGGDSGQDTSDFAKTIQQAVIDRLGDQWHGDQSQTNVYSFPFREFADTLDSATWRKRIRANAEKILPRILAFLEEEKRKPIITASSMALHRDIGDMFEGNKRFDWVSPKNSIANLLGELDKLGIRPDHTVLFGLPAVYEPDSLFAGPILDSALPLPDGVGDQIVEFIRAFKVQGSGIDMNKFYGIITQILQGKCDGDPKLTALARKKVFLHAGTSEADRLFGIFQRNQELYTVISESTPEKIAQKLKDASGSNKTILIAIRPFQVMKAEIVEKSLQAI